jgi:hypothetical protein
MTENKTDEITLDDITNYFRKKYPKAVQVVLKVGYHGHKIAVETYFNDTGLFTTRTLDGTWNEDNEQNKLGD